MSANVSKELDTQKCEPIIRQGGLQTRTLSCSIAVAEAVKLASGFAWLSAELLATSRSIANGDSNWTGERRLCTDENLSGHW